MIVRPRFGLKAPIAGVQFSNEEVSIELEFDTKDNDWEKVREELQKVEKGLVSEYFIKLKEEIKDGQGKVIDELKIAISKEYDDKLKLARDSIIKLEGLLKANGIQYK